MNPLQVYMCSPSWTLLPPPSPFHPSGSSQCTSPKHPVSCFKPGLTTRFIHDIGEGEGGKIWENGTEDISWGRCFFLRAPQSWWIWSAVSPGFSVVVPKAATRRQNFLMLHNYLFQLIYLLLLIWRAVIHGVAKSRTRLSDWSDLIEV